MTPPAHMLFLFMRGIAVSLVVENTFDIYFAIASRPFPDRLHQLAMVDYCAYIVMPDTAKR